MGEISSRPLGKRERSNTELTIRAKYIVALGFIIAAVVLSGCGERPVAVVNGHRITEGEFISRLKKSGGEQVLRTMIDRRLIEEEFGNSGLEVPAGEVSERLSQMQSGFPTPGAFQEFLEGRGTSVEELEKEVVFNTKLEMLASKEVTVSDEGLTKFYEDYRERYDKPLRVTIREIVLSSKQDAEDVAAELAEPDADFAAVATQYSLSPTTRQYGGKRPESPILQLYPQELRAAAQDLKVGEASGPIAADGQWYIIKVEERKAPEKASLEKVRDEVVGDYKRAQAEPLDQLVKRLREKALVSIVAPEFQELNEVYRRQEELPEFGVEEESGPREESGE